MNALVHLDKQQVERIYEELQGEMKHVLDFEIINYYKLLYTLFNYERDISALEEELDKLKKVYKNILHFRSCYTCIVEDYCAVYSIDGRMG